MRISKFGIWLRSANCRSLPSVFRRPSSHLLTLSISCLRSGNGYRLITSPAPAFLSISSAVSASSTAQSRNCAITAGSIEVLARSQQHLARFLSSCGSRICLLPRKHMQASQERATPRYRYFVNSHFSPKFRPKGSSKIRPSQAKAVCLLLSGTGASGSVASSRFAAPARFGLSGSGH